MPPRISSEARSVPDPRTSAKISGTRWMKVSPRSAPAAKLTKNVASRLTRASLSDSVSVPASDTVPTSVTLTNASTIGPIYDQIGSPALLHSTNEPS